MANIGALEGRGRQDVISLTARRGQRGEAPREGMFTVANCDCFCKVLDHLRMSAAN